MAMVVYKRVGAVSYTNLFVTRRFVPGVFKRYRVTYLGFVLVFGSGVGLKS